MAETFADKGPSAALPPPRNMVGPVAWVRENLFSSIGNSILTIVGFYLIYLVITGLFGWAVTSAVWTGADGKACQPPAAPDAGACWPFITAKFGQFMYGRYPDAERWRVDLTYAMALAALIPMMVPAIPGKKWAALFFFGVFPGIAYWLLTGMTPNGKFGDIWDWIGIACLLITLALFLGPRLTGASAASQMSATALAAPFAFVSWPIMLGLLVNHSGLIDLPTVQTQYWGGMLVTLVVAVVGIVMSLPIGIVLALGRRSKMPLVKYACVGFIEMVRGVPLISVLFMASVMLPLFMPPGVEFDKLLRALVGVSLFAGAYMAETIRGGLQAIPRGQFEAGDALGLSFPQKTGLIILPQALKLVIPSIVNSSIGLFKDTSLVFIVGLFDLLGIVQQNMTDTKWFSPSTPVTGYVFAGAIFWVFCFAMSRYSQFMERKLNTGHR